MNALKQTTQIEQSQGASSRAEELSLRRLAALPVNPERDEKLEEHIVSHGHELDQDVEKAEKVLTNEKLGLWLGTQAVLYKEASTSYTYFRLLKDKVQKEKADNKECRDAYKTVGGILNTLKRANAKVTDVLNTVPRGIVRVGNAISSLDEKVSRTILLHPLQRQLKGMRASTERIKPLLAQKGLNIQNTKDLYKALKEKNNKHEKTSLDILSKGLVENLEKTHAVENFLLRHHIKQEASIYGKHVFSSLDISLDSLSQTISIKPKGSNEAAKEVPYSFDSRGYMLFDGEISLLRAKDKAVTKTSEKKLFSQNSTTVRENNISESKNIPNFTERSAVVNKFMKDKKHAFFVPKDENEDFMTGRTDTIVLRHGESPMKKITLKISARKKQHHAGEEVTEFSAQMVDEQKNTGKTYAPFPLATLSPLGVIGWSTAEQTKKFLQYFSFRPMTRQMLDQARKEIEEQYSVSGTSTPGSRKPKVEITEHILNQKETPWSVTPVQRTAQITINGHVERLPLVEQDGKIVALREYKEKKEDTQTKMQHIPSQVRLAGKLYRVIPLSNTSTQNHHNTVTSNPAAPSIPHAS